MQIVLNEKEINIQENTSLQTILEQNEFASQKGIAVAVNNKVVPRAEWPSFQLQENNQVLVIIATKGG